MKRKTSHPTHSKKIKPSRVKLVVETLLQYKKWFDESTLDRNLYTGASRRKHKHIHNVTFLSKPLWLAFPSPAEYRRQHAGKHISR